MANSSFKEDLYDRLQDSEYAAAYLGEAASNGYEDFLLALGDIVESRNYTKSQFAEAIGMHRAPLSRVFAEGGNPTTKTLFKILDELGIKVWFALEEQEKPKVARKRSKKAQSKSKIIGTPKKARA